MAKRQPSINRADFVSAYMATGISYEQSVAVYDAMNRLIGDAMVNARKVNFGRVGSIRPKRRKGRVVRMPFVRTKDGILKEPREYYVGMRMVYTFEIYPKFASDHNLKA